MTIIITWLRLVCKPSPSLSLFPSLDLECSLNFFTFGNNILRAFLSFSGAWEWRWARRLLAFRCFGGFSEFVKLGEVAVRGEMLKIVVGGKSCNGGWGFKVLGGWSG